MIIENNQKKNGRSTGTNRLVSASPLRSRKLSMLFYRYDRTIGLEDYVLGG